MRLKANFGFTLIELIVVVGIVSIMASAVMAVLDPFQQVLKARDARVKSDLAQIQKTLESYYQDNGSYPISCGDYTIGTPSCIPWGSAWTPYMNIVPKDPTSAHNYLYYRPDGQTYYLYANLGRGGKDPQACNTAGSACSSLLGYGIPATTCGGTCNFGVSSPNTTP